MEVVFGRCVTTPPSNEEQHTDSDNAMLSNVTVGAGVYCVAKATLYDFQKTGLGKIP